MCSSYPRLKFNDQVADAVPVEDGYPVGPAAAGEVVEVNLAVGMPIAKMPRFHRVVEMHDFGSMDDIQLAWHRRGHAIAKCRLPEMGLHVPDGGQLQPVCNEHAVENVLIHPPDRRPLALQIVDASFGQAIPFPTGKID